MCLKCGQVCCSRYIKGHMAIHASETKHGLGVSFSDMSVWCYDCNEYIDNPDIDFQKVLSTIKEAKFPSNDEAAQQALEDENDKLLKGFYSK
jgi:uncharacterized UBP type Zn finger protein